MGLVCHLWPRVWEQLGGDGTYTSSEEPAGKGTAEARRFFSSKRKLRARVVHSDWRPGALQHVSTGWQLLGVWLKPYGYRWWLKVSGCTSTMSEVLFLGPGWCGSGDWVLACEPKGCRFDSQSGHIPALWARSPVGGMQEATNVSLFLFLPPFLSL